jgi:hypothetical protein
VPEQKIRIRACFCDAKDAAFLALAAGELGPDSLVAGKHFVVRRFGEGAAQAVPSASKNELGL